MANTSYSPGNSWLQIAEGVANPKNFIMSTQCYCENEMFAPCCNIPIEMIQGKHIHNLIRLTETDFDHILHLSNRVAQNVAGDGNCYFRCLNELGTEEFHAPIRERIVNFMISHMNVF